MLGVEVGDGGDGDLVALPGVAAVDRGHDLDVDAPCESLRRLTPKLVERRIHFRALDGGAHQVVLHR